jgi:hypothetical protein
MNLLIGAQMNKNIDEVMGNYMKRPVEVQKISKEDLEALALSHEKDKTVKRRVTYAQYVLLLTMAICSLPFSINLIAVLLHALLISVIAYFVYRDIKFKVRLDEQSRAEAVSDFIEYRIRIFKEGLTYLKTGRFIIYPLITAASINNIVAGLQKYEGAWLLLLFLFSVVIPVYIAFYLEGAIKEFDKKLKSLD